MAFPPGPSLASLEILQTSLRRALLIREFLVCFECSGPLKEAIQAQLKVSKIAIKLPFYGPYKVTPL